MNPFLHHIKDIDLDDKIARKEFIKTAMNEIRADIQNEQYDIEKLESFFLKCNFLLLHSAVKIEMQRRDLKSLTHLIVSKDIVLRRYRTSMDLQDKEIQKAASIIRAQKRIIASFNIPQEEYE